MLMEAICFRRTARRATSHSTLCGHHGLPLFVSCRDHRFSPSSNLARCRCRPRIFRNSYGLDPDDKGKTLWSTRIGKGGVLGGIEFGAAADSTNVYAPVSDWSADPKTGGGLFALDIKSGKMTWAAHAAVPACADLPGCSASQQAPATVIPGAVFSGSLDGHMRAYDTSDGRVLWDFDTARNYKTVNGVAARGGSINYAGPVIVGGVVYIASGYSTNAGMPGNVLLAFSVDGK